MKAKTLKEFDVYGIARFDVCVKIAAESLAEAIEKSKTLEETDFAKPLGDYNDGDLKITGVFEINSGLS